MKLRVYLRVAEGARGPRVAASSSPNYEPLMSGSGWQAKPLPTAMFALDLDVPDAVLHHAERVLATLAVDEHDAQVAAAVRPPVAEAIE